VVRRLLAPGGAVPASQAAGTISADAETFINKLLTDPTIHGPA
jgi:hypothetical protein